jgi:hypothetical protein
MVIGHRSAIRHTRCCPICKSISGVRRRHAVNSEDSIENNKQHAVGIEQIKKKLIVCTAVQQKINIGMNSLWMKQITAKEEKKKKKNEWAKGIHF